MPAYQQDKLRRIEKQLQQLRNKRDALATDYDMRYPPKDTMILPSRLGNILRAAEAYPQDRYSANSVALWPRMVWAIDKEYMGHVDAANDQCSFLLNCSLLSGIYALLAIAASLYVWFFQGNFSISFIYLTGGILSFGIAWFFYSASLLNVTKYGNLIRSSYDLFRFDLLEKLHLKLPVDNKKEKYLWQDISDFVTIGELYDKKHFDYPAHILKEDIEAAELESLVEAAGVSDDEN